MEGQDWEYKVIERKDKPKGQKSVNQAYQQGKEVESFKKVDYTNKHNQLDGKHVATVLNDEMTFGAPQTSHEFKIALQQARNAKGWTQKELAQKINEKQSTVSDWEAGRIAPDNGTIARLDGVLGSHLPRIKKPKKKSSSQIE